MNPYSDMDSSSNRIHETNEAEGDAAAAAAASKAEPLNEAKEDTPPLSPPPVVVNHANTTDQDLLQRAIQDAGRWAYGIVLIELWVLNDDRTKLMRPPGGIWLDPVFYNAIQQQEEDETTEEMKMEHEHQHQQQQQQQHHATTATTASSPAADIIRELFDIHHPHYQEPALVSPGVGLPGVLWSEADRVSSSSGTNMMVWRDMAALAQDPDHATNLRLSQLVQAGLGWAGAVAFDKKQQQQQQQHQQQGIVIYMARQSTDRRRLHSSLNEQYLRAAADWIACAYALRGPRQTAVLERQMELRQAIQRAKNRLLTMKKMGINLSTLVLDHSAMHDDGGRHGDHHSWYSWSTLRQMVIHHIPKKMASLYDKCWGGQVPGPPFFSWEQTIWSMMGAFLTIIMLVKLNDRVTDQYGTAYQIFLPPLASLVVQLYGLTAAPATQPINILLGQALSITIAICLKYNHHVGMDGYPLYLQQAFAVALAAAVMVKVGVTHPPGSVFGIVFVSTLQHLSWGNLAFIMVADVITIGFATILNNLNEKRQYPTAWGFRQVYDMVFLNPVARWLTFQWASWRRMCRRQSQNQTATASGYSHDNTATKEQSD